MIQGDRLRDIRQQRGLSQAALGQRVGLDGQYIHKLEHGVLRSITTTTLERLVHALHVSSDYLLGLSDQAAPAAVVTSQPQTQAKQRQRDAGKKHGRGKIGGDESSPPIEHPPPARDVAAAVVTPAPEPARSPAMCPHCYTPMVPMDDGQGQACPGCRYSVTGAT
jgi:transcriptional regulator with XRE-family HTH domain